MLPAFLPPPPFLSSRSPFRTCTTPLMSVSPKISIGSVPDALSSSLQSHIATILSTQQVVNVAISGGSLPKILAKAITPDLHIHKWRAYLADERCVSLDHQDSNYAAIKNAIPDLHVQPIDPKLPTDECAKDYQAKLTKQIGDDIVFDVVLLGLGPDGHTCSLFPEHELVSCCNFIFFMKSTTLTIADNSCLLLHILLICLAEGGYSPSRTDY